MPAPGATSRRIDLRSAGALKAAIFVGYVLISLLLGDRFPFCLFDMYSLGRPYESALEIVANGRSVEYGDYVQFHGEFAPPPQPDYLFAWEEKEARQYIAARTVPRAPAGSEELEARVCTATVDRDGAALACPALWRGTALRQ